MYVGLADQEDTAQLSQLLWQHAAPDERASQTLDAFAADFAVWWSKHEASHLAFVARPAESDIVGMAWLAILPRVPRPGTSSRRSADIQSVYVAPEHRGRRIGSSLIQAAWAHAVRVGASRVTVSSGERAVPLYQKLGFASSSQLLEKVPE